MPFSLTEYYREYWSRKDRETLDLSSQELGVLVSEVEVEQLEDIYSG